MKERITIIFIALIIGLLLTTIVFYFYQTTNSKKNTIAKQTKTEVTKTITPTAAQDKLFVTINEPTHESVTTKRTISVRGLTNPENTVVASTNAEDKVGVPTSDGSFSLTVDIDAGTNKLIVKAISKSGESIQEERIVTFSSEEF